MPPPPSRYQQQRAASPPATDTDEDVSMTMPSSSPTTPLPAREAFDDDRLSSLEKEVLREYQKLKNNLDTVSLIFLFFLQLIPSVIVVTRCPGGKPAWSSHHILLHPLPPPVLSLRPSLPLSCISTPSSPP